MLHLERAPYFRGLLRRSKVCIDPSFSGECRRLFEDESRRKSFVARRGMTLDSVGELLWDCGICDSRPGYPTEILEILDQVLDHEAVMQSSLTLKLAEMLSDGKLYRLSEIRRALSMGPDADVGRLVRRLRQYPFSVGLRKVKTASGLRYGVIAADLHKLKQFIPVDEASEAYA